MWIGVTAKRLGVHCKLDSSHSANPVLPFVSVPPLFLLVIAPTTGGQFREQLPGTARRDGDKRPSRNLSRTRVGRTGEGCRREEGKVVHWNVCVDRWARHAVRAQKKKKFKREASVRELKNYRKAFGTRKDRVDPESTALERQGAQAKIVDRRLHRTRATVAFERQGTKAKIVGSNRWNNWVFD